eukprot:1060120-Rhodomonas_salina.2
MQLSASVVSNTPWYPGKLLCCSTDRMPSELQLLNLSVSWTRYKYVWAHKPVGNKSIVIRARNPCAGRIFLGPMDMLYGNLICPPNLNFVLRLLALYLPPSLNFFVSKFGAARYLGTLYPHTGAYTSTRVPRVPGNTGRNPTRVLRDPRTWYPGYPGTRVSKGTDSGRLSVGALPKHTSLYERMCAGVLKLAIGSSASGTSSGIAVML